MTISLPMSSDTLRHEARMIREAAERAATQMGLCELATIEAHAKIRNAEAELEALLAAIHADDPKRELLVRVGDVMRALADSNSRSALAGNSSSPPPREEKP
jgi:hypothetical protein